ncbi:MAG: ABC transporter permease [Chloroflexi bacterium]|nr:ABC transporter permease [Chloroflexota bacterium]
MDETAADRRSGLAWSRYTQQAGLIAVVVLLGSAFAAINGDFASSDNLIELFRAVTLYFIVACASTLVLVGGGLDFSIGAVYALGAVVAGLLMTNGVPWPVAVLGGIGVGIAAGVINASVSVYLHVPPLIATLGMFFFAGGIAVVLTGGTDVYGFPDDFINIGAGELGGVPYLIFYAIAIGIVFHVLLESTVVGYNIRAIGGNRAAAAANGIRVARMDIGLYALSGGIAALAGILGAARLSTASPAAGGASLTFQVVTAVIIGGTSLFGGIGTIAGSALGAILFAEINNGLQVINVNPLYQNIFIGVILVAAVAIDQYRRRRRFRAGG